MMKGGGGVGKEWMADLADLADLERKNPLIAGVVLLILEARSRLYYHLAKTEDGV